MADLKLYYFSARGAAEPIRQILCLAGIKFDDIRKTFDEWKEIKSTAPYGLMPFVVFPDGKSLAGSMVIARHLAEENGLAGKDAFQNALLAAVVDHIIDMSKLVYEVIMADSTQKEAKQKIFDEKMPEKLQFLESKIKDGSMEGVKCGKGANWADIYAAIAIKNFEKQDKTKVEKHPILISLMNQVCELPEIKNWIATRPQTEH